jgi:hypothetical protein
MLGQALVPNPSVKETSCGKPQSSLTSNVERLLLAQRIVRFWPQGAILFDENRPFNRQPRIPPHSPIRLAGRGLGLCRWGRLCAAEEHRAAGPRAQRAS